MSALKEKYAGMVAERRVLRSQELRRRTVAGLNEMKAFRRAVRTYDQSYDQGDFSEPPRIIFASLLGVYSIHPDILKAQDPVANVEIRLDPFNYYGAIEAESRVVFKATSDSASVEQKQYEANGQLPKPTRVNDDFEISWPNDKTKKKHSNTKTALNAIHDSFLEIFDPERAVELYQQLKLGHGLEKSQR